MLRIVVLRFFQKIINKTPQEVEETREHVKLDLKYEEQNVKSRLLKQRSGWILINFGEDL